MNPLISIIVPVYQVEKYLDKCVSSIIAQSYQNIEIILVDDGSTDRCPEICDQYQKEDSRVIVIHKQNGGLSQARNVGLEIAQGDYIGFVDSDDWIEPDMYEMLMSSLLKTRADIAVCRYQVEYEEVKSIKRNSSFFEEKLYSSEEVLRRIISGDSFIRTVVWNKLYRKQIIDKVKFPEGKIYEDVLWTALIVGNSSNIVAVDCVLYHYLHRYESISHNNQNINKLFDKIEMNKQRIMFIHKKYPILEKIAIYKLQYLCYEESILLCLKNDYLNENQEIINHLHRCYCQTGPIIFHYIENVKTKICRVFYRLFPILFLKTYMFYRKYINITSIN